MSSFSAMLYLSTHCIFFLISFFFLDILPTASNNEAIQRLRACKHFPFNQSHCESKGATSHRISTRGKAKANTYIHSRLLTRAITLDNALRVALVVIVDSVQNYLDENWKHHFLFLLKQFYHSFLPFINLLFINDQN